MSAHARRSLATPVSDLVASLREEYLVDAEAGPGPDRVTAVRDGVAMALCRERGWWCHERHSRGCVVVRDRMHPEGMEWVTARTVAALLTTRGTRL